MSTEPSFDALAKKLQSMSDVEECAEKHRTGDSRVWDCILRVNLQSASVQQRNQTKNSWWWEPKSRSLFYFVLLQRHRDNDKDTETMTTKNTKTKSK